jgi:hypothetical protein
LVQHVTLDVILFENYILFFSFEIGGPDENDGHCLNIRETEPEAKEKNGKCL